MVMRIAPWSNDPLWILHYTLHVTFLSPSVFHNRYTCISFTLVYTATTVPHCPTISPLVCAEKEVQKTFVLRAYIRFTASTLSTHPVYCVLQTGRGGERDKKPKEKKNIQNRSEEFSQQTSSWCPARGRNDVDVRERSSDARIKKNKKMRRVAGGLSSFANAPVYYSMVAYNPLYPEKSPESILL